MKLAVISTYNTKCGIAEYTHSLYSPLENELDIEYLANYDVVDRKYADDKNVVRVWKIKDADYKGVLTYLKVWQPDVVHIQAHSAHHSMTGLKNLLTGLAKLPRSTKIFITPHIVRAKQFDIGTLALELGKVHKVIVHSVNDYNYLISLGLRNIVHFTHPYPSVQIFNKEKLKESLSIQRYPIIATHGLIGAHKGFIQVIQAFKKLLLEEPNALLLLLTPVSASNPESTVVYKEMKNMIKDISNNVLFFSEFLDENILSILIQLADIGILAYEEVGESASGAIRKLLSAGVPTIVSDIPIMEEYKDEVIKIKDNRADSILRGIRSALGNKEELKRVRDRARRTAGNNTYEIAAEKLLGYYTTS